MSLPETLRALRGPLLWSALCVAIASGLYFAWDFADRRQQAATVTALNSGKDEAINPASASDRVILARITELLRRDRFDEAHALMNDMTPASSDAYRTLALYNIANYRVRRAAELITKGDLDSATALVNVAKGEYRMALKQRPDDWDLKHNLDVAMRMVRDLPQNDADPEEVPPDAPTRVWTDLPGVPRGLP